MGAPSVCQQPDQYYAVRIDLPTTAVVGPIPCVSLGPYATVQEAIDQYPNLPPPPAPQTMALPTRETSPPPEDTDEP